MNPSVDHPTSTNRKPQKTAAGGLDGPHLIAERRPLRASLNYQPQSLLASSPAETPAASGSDVLVVHSLTAGMSSRRSTSPAGWSPTVVSAPEITAANVASSPPTCCPINEAIENVEYDAAIAVGDVIDGRHHVTAGHILRRLSQDNVH